MKLITCQHEWVKQCQLRYKVEPPVGYHFEDAHYPEPECRNGTETVRLWYPDHIVQGALQTLNLSHPCMHGYRKRIEREILTKEYPEYLSFFDEAWFFVGSLRGTENYLKRRGIFRSDYMFSEKYFEDRVKSGGKAFREGLGIFSEEYLLSGRRKEISKSVMEKLHSEKTPNGKSVFSSEAASKAHEAKTADGKSQLGVENGRRLHKEKDEEGRSTSAQKGGLAANAEKDELGRSLNGLRLAENVNEQVWKSLVDGHISTAAGVAKHNKVRGWDPQARVKIS